MIEMRLTQGTLEEYRETVLSFSPGIEYEHTTTEAFRLWLSDNNFEWGEVDIIGKFEYSDYVLIRRKNLELNK